MLKKTFWTGVLIGGFALYADAPAPVASSQAPAPATAVSVSIALPNVTAAAAAATQTVAAGQKALLDQISSVQQQIETEKKIAESVPGFLKQTFYLPLMKWLHDRTAQELNKPNPTDADLQKNLDQHNQMLDKLKTFNQSAPKA